MKITKHPIATCLGLAILCASTCVIIACQTNTRSTYYPGLSPTDEAVIPELSMRASERISRDGSSMLNSDNAPLALARPGEDIWVIVKPPARDPARYRPIHRPMRL